MTNAEKERVRIMRFAGQDYITIAAALNVSVSSIRSYCNRNGLSEEALTKSSVCLCCGKAITQPGRGKRKMFCSEKCRSAWRRSTQQYSDTLYHHICSGCGKHFDTLGNKAQKYCSRLCYQTHRKGGAA